MVQAAEVEPHLHTPNYRAHPAIETLQLILFGGFSNNVASSVTNPIDLIKVRQQLENTSFTSASTTNASQANAVKPIKTFWGTTLVNMVKKEGILSIYKGWSPSMLREISYSGIRFGIYDFCKASLLKVAPASLEKDSFAIKLGAGMLSGATGSAVANPADVVSLKFYFSTLLELVFILE